jgi:hypothetical protein
VRDILIHLGEPITPAIAPARCPGLFSSPLRNEERAQPTVDSIAIACRLR